MPYGTLMIVCTLAILVLVGCSQHTQRFTPPLTKAEQLCYIAGQKDCRK